MQGQKLRGIVDQARIDLEKISEPDSSAKPSYGKWSQKEILGHLIDSAVNNYARFANTELSSGLIFNGYDQEKWVKRGGYQDRLWMEIIELWSLTNQHLSRLLDNIPNDVMLKKHMAHNLDLIAWKTVPTDEQATLDYLVLDYLTHLEHHLRQILPDYRPVVTASY